MALSISNERAERLAREVIEVSGENLEDVIIQALEDRLQQLRNKRKRNSSISKAEIMEISRRCSSLPDLDTRTPDEILGYNEYDGLD